MKNFVLSLILCLSAPAVSFAQNNIEGMRTLTVYALMQYGQNLYDRGDFDGATAVFDHVLNFDAHQARALRYLKDMGRLYVAPPNKIANPVDLADTKSLQEAIEAKKQSIEKLQSQIMQMRATLSAQSAEN